MDKNWSEIDLSTIYTNMFVDKIFHDYTAGSVFL